MFDKADAWHAGHCRTPAAADGRSTGRYLALARDRVSEALSIQHSFNANIL